MRFAIACAVNDRSVLLQRLKRSDDWDRVPSVTLPDAKAAADVNDLIEDLKKGVDVLVYAHQDVFLPTGWLGTFERQWKRSEELFGRVALAGVYGVKTRSADRRVPSIRAGHLLDRGKLLKESALLPRDVDSLDECVVAISVASELRLDPVLGWHFWATDLCLQAQERGMVAVAVDAYCEHWSTQSRHGFLPAGYAESREVFRKKWRHRLPVETPSERVE